ncbi:hypothetical protein PR048_016501 [Dryococelus australis]|uniref:Uncharacterized protein n=1 Tax=Dryococelus australis TaxID=614101 RepID=A0ABQ9HJY1_9NEOP|nr:hypothetical protein PR048_016501 [Dryococelus australis]
MVTVDEIRPPNHCRASSSHKHWRSTPSAGCVVQGLVNGSEQRADGNVPFLRSLVANGLSLKLHERCSYGLEGRSRVNDVCVERCRNARAGEAGDPQEDPLTSSIVKHGVAPIGIEPRSPWTEIIAFTTFPDFCPRKDYTRPNTIKKDLSSEKKSEDPDLGTERRVRSSVAVFNIKQDCLYCGEEASVRKETKKKIKFRKIICEVPTLPFKDSVIVRALERGRSPMVGLNTAKSTRQRNHFRGRGRPEDECRAFAFTKLCAYMDSAEDSQFILSDLVETMKNFNTNNPNDSVCTANNILHDIWYLDNENTGEEESISIVEAAADIIGRGIRSLVFDTKIYPAMESLDSGQLPETLKTFLNRVIQGEVVERKNTAIREALMSACHPRSYISPILLGIEAYIHWHHASRQLVDILSSLSFSANFKEFQRYEFSALEHDRANTGASKKGYIQYVFDNADFNIRSLTGHGTFHSIGGVPFITAAQNRASMTVNRLLHPRSADTIPTRGKLQVNCYKKSALLGLKGVNIRELVTASDATARAVKNAIELDVLWSSATWLEESLAPSWNVRECKRHIQGSCIMTFDQPLYAKAPEIIVAASPGELGSATLRLDGFHFLVSFMGSIGFIMSGSGIEELWMQSCGAHMLNSQALIPMILGMENLFGVYQEELHKLFLEVSTGEKMIPDAVESPVLVSFLASFERKCTALSEQSRTGKLWVQYLRQCVWSMLPYLHAAGHIHYTKSAHLYVHQMEELPSRMPPHEYNKFASKDLSIEQDLRRVLKTKGGLTSGRGITESTLAYFVAAFPVCLKLCNALEELSGIKAGSSEYNVELRDSHRTRDARDVAVLLSWLKEHSPWDLDCLRSHASGVVGDDSINSVARSILIRNDVVEVNSHQLFMRIVYVMKTDNDLKHFLSYELSPRPPALFDGMAIRKTVKSAFLQLFSCTKPEENSTNDPRRIVFDGGQLLHALVSPCTATYGQQESKCTIEGDDDTLIVKRAPELASVRKNVIVVASDSDIVVMLLVRTTDDMELRVLSPGTNTKCNKVYNVREIQENIEEGKDNALFCHTVTGCDTTSALLGKGKRKAWKILQRSDMRNASKVFNSPESTKEEVCAAGEKFVISLYGRINVISLAELRVIQYTRSIAKQPVTAAFELATLTPTSAACAEHSLRTYYQEWCDSISINPVDWGGGNWMEDSWFQYWPAGHQHLSLCCASFPVVVRQTVATDVNAGVLDWSARPCVDIVEEEVD